MKYCTCSSYFTPIGYNSHMQANAQTYSRQQLIALGLSLSDQAMTFVALYVLSSYLQCVVVALVDNVM